MNFRQGEETFEQFRNKLDPRRPLGSAQQMERNMSFSFFERYLRSRRVYRQIVRELSQSSDRDLLELRIDRADILAIARAAAAEA
jgi:hypothetical protein